MENYRNEVFGSLTLKQKKLYDIKSVLKKDVDDLDYLFKNSLNKLESLSVIEEERRIALENLRNLTSQLKTGRIGFRHGLKTEYFSD